MQLTISAHIFNGRQAMIELKQLRDEWLKHESLWDLNKYQFGAEHAISLGDMHLAIDICQVALNRFTPHPTIYYYLTLAHANCGSRDAIATLLDELLALITETDEKYVEALCLLGRVEKEKYTRLHGTTAGDEALFNALEAYHTAYKFSGASYPGINTAVLFVLSDGLDIAKKIAGQIIIDNARDQDEFWSLATLAEAHLLLGEFDSARFYYQQVHDKCGTHYGLMASVRRHLPIIRSRLEVPEDFDELVQGPAIAVFAGHMYDEAGRSTPRFPESLGDRVASEIGTFIDDADIKIGFCSAACGGDLLFAMELLRRNLELHIILPFAAQDFLDTSVKIKGVDQSKDFWDVLDKASSVVYATEEEYLGGAVQFSYATDLLEGYARLRAEQSGGHVEIVVAIDPYSAGLQAGTLEQTMLWLDEGLDITVVDISKLRNNSNSNSSPMLQQLSVQGKKRALDQSVKSHVEITLGVPGGIPESSQQSVTMIDDLLDLLSVGGNIIRADGFSQTFATVQEAAEFSYHMLTLAKVFNWQDYGLPVTTNVQIAIHTAPVFSQLGQAGVSATQHSAKSLVAVTPPGCIYLSEPTAALLKTRGPDAYVSTYLGKLALDDAAQSLYRLYRA
ncbi:MAG: hypothetical protein ACI9YG_000285 [Candidatus Azotimanducaceae bacterium]|jgi:hypothetical protein